MDIEIEIPQYFLCPISLQIMKDPVTIITGITYDRESIELWLITAIANEVTAVCPVTKQPLPSGSELTPNHMLRKLIQAWCITNAKNGIDRIPTPKSQLQRSMVYKLLRDIRNPSEDISRHSKALRKMDELAKECDKNQKCMAEAGVAKAMILFVLRTLIGKNSCYEGLEEALRIIRLAWKWNSSIEIKKIVEDNLDFIQALVLILKNHTKFDNNVMVTEALRVLKHVTEISSASLEERLIKHDFFEEIVNVVHKNVTPDATRAALQILINLCPLGHNKMIIVEAGAVHELIELELSHPEKKTTELVFVLLANLCSCADGRQQLLRHSGGIAVVAKRLLRVSPTTDEHALWIFESIARSSATHEVVQEMLRVSAVSKLLMVLQTDCASHLKKKASEILRLHSSNWINSPCIQLYLSRGTQDHSKASLCLTN